MRSPLVVVMIAGAIALVACSSQPRPQQLTLTAKGMSYSPAAFEVMAGVPVELTFVNQDAPEHDFSILEIPVESLSEPEEASAQHEMEMGEMGMDPMLHVAAQHAESGHLTFTPTKPGTYEFFCTVPGHKEAGMVGTMTVLPR